MRKLSIFPGQIGGIIEQMGVVVGGVGGSSGVGNGDIDNLIDIWKQVDCEVCLFLEQRPILAMQARGGGDFNRSI